MTGGAAPPAPPATLRVEVWVDVVCPWCYVGKRHLEEAVHGFEHPAAVEVRYRSFELEPPVVSPAGRDSMQRVLALARQAGIDMDLDSIRTAASFDAHRLVQLALASGGPAEQSAVLERLFSACFCEGRPLDDVPTLQRLAAEAGLDERRVASVLAADDYAAEVRSDEALAVELGIRAVPHLRVGALSVSGAEPAARMREALRLAWDQT